MISGLRNKATIFLFQKNCFSFTSAKTLHDENQTTLFHFSFLFLIFNSQFALCANYYWVGAPATGATMQTIWATTSGGNIFHVQVPTSFERCAF
jgi:hypothetical protein